MLNLQRRASMFGTNKRRLHRAIFTPNLCSSIELNATERFAQQQHNNYLNQLKEEREALIKRCEERRK